MTTVSDLYEARVRAGQLEPDAAQRGVLPALDRLVRDLGAAAPPPDPPGRGRDSCVRGPGGLRRRGGAHHLAGHPE